MATPRARWRWIAAAIAVAALLGLFAWTRGPKEPATRRDATLATRSERRPTLVRRPTKVERDDRGRATRRHVAQQHAAASRTAADRPADQPRPVNSLPQPATSDRARGVDPLQRMIAKYSVEDLELPALLGKRLERGVPEAVWALLDLRQAGADRAAQEAFVRERFPADLKLKA